MTVGLGLYVHLLVRRRRGHDRLARAVSALSDAVVVTAADAVAHFSRCASLRTNNYDCTCGVVETLLVMADSLRKVTLIELENEGVIAWGDPGHRQRWVDNT